MKKAFGAIALCALVFFSACGGGKPDMDDPKSVAKYTCDKMKEMMAIMSADKPDESKITAISDEMEKFQKELEAHHGTKFGEFEAKFEAEIKTSCPDMAGL